jgi:hypothetical protein
MSCQSQLNADPLPWLLQSASPGVRYMALRDLVDSPKTAELRTARKAAHKKGPIAVILRKMEKEAFWVKPGPGYNPKYRSAVWSLLALAQLGASIKEDERIGKACTYMLDHGLADGGQFTSLTSGDASGTIDCLQGNMCWALLELGCDDPRLEVAFDWMARTVTGEGIAPARQADASWHRHTGTPMPPPAPAHAPHPARRYYAYNSGPTFACGINGKLPCAWGGVKVMLALARLPKERRTPVIQRAIRHGTDFLFSVDPATALYPFAYGDKPNRNWWKFGFPVFYVTDLLQVVEALVALGHARDRRLANAIQIIRDKQDARGRWAFEFDYLKGKMWLDFGEKNQPNKWVTLRALRLLKAAAF